MRRPGRFFIMSWMILTLALMLGAVLAPASQVRAAANWWWIVRYESQAPGGYVIKAGATSNGAKVRAGEQGISTSTRLKVYSYGSFVTAPKYSETGYLDVWNPSGFFQYQ